MKIKRLASLLLCVLLTFSLLLSASADVVSPSSGYSLILDENWELGTFYLYQNSHLWYHLPSENPFPVSECMVLIGWRPDYDTSGQIFTYAVESFNADDFIDHDQVITFTPVWEINHSDSDGNHFCDKCGDFLGSGYAVLSLGAKVNEKTSSLRLGAFYNGKILTSAERASVEDLGMLFYPSRLRRLILNNTKNRLTKISRFFIIQSESKYTIPRDLLYCARFSPSSAC